MTYIPPEFAQRMRGLHGEAGAAWLESLPGLIAKYAQDWSLSTGPPFEPLSYNYVLPAVRAAGDQVVLKLGYPHPELLSEIAALRFYAGSGCLRLLESDPEYGALLLERVLPGESLAEWTDDEAATAAAIEVMGWLWRPAPTQHRFPTVEKWAQGLSRLRAEFDGGTGPFPEALVILAEGLFSELLPSQSERVVLHGDLHHYNILTARRAPWLALDPKGVIGEREYELGAWLRNPYPQILTDPNARQKLTRRVDQFVAAFAFDKVRVLGWAAAQAVLSAWWSYEDRAQDHARWSSHAELLASLYQGA